MLRIVIVGLNNAGKTTILYNLHLGQAKWMDVPLWEDLFGETGGWNL